MTTTAESVGDLLRAWRQRRRYSQLDLAGEAGVSTRHLSFVETGRASASREMLVRLAEQLGMPLRARNRLLLAGGFAPAHGELSLDAPDMSGVRAVLDAVLAGHAPFPALAVNAHWELIAANEAVASLLEGVSAALLAPPFVSAVDDVTGAGDSLAAGTIFGLMGGLDIAQAARLGIACAAITLQSPYATSELLSQDSLRTALMRVPEAQAL